MRPRRKPGPTTPLDAARSALVAENADLAFRMSRGPQRDFPRLRDEIESNACLGLIRAALAFDPARSGNFRMVASYYIASAIGDAFRVARPRGFRACRIDRGDAPEAVPLGATDLPSRGPAPERPAMDAEAEASFERRLAPLTAPQAEACRASYARGETDAQIARAMGVSPDTSRRLRWRALAILDGSRPSPRLAGADPCPS